MLNLLLLSATWNTAYEASPANTDTPSEGDDKIRDVKVEVRTRLEKEHGWGGTSTADGWHLAGSAFPYYQSAAPTNRADAATALDSDDAGRIWIDSDDNYLRTWDGDSFEIICAGAYVAATAPTGISGADDTGALYIDSDTEDLKWWTGSAWADIDIAGNAATATLATTATTATGVNDVGGGADLLCKVVNIGDWNMDSTTTVNVAHGVTFANIRFISAVIRNDLNTIWFPLPSTSGSGVLDGTIDVDAIYIDSTNVVLQRLVGGSFDNTNFDSTSYNRGYITIWYTSS